jgi:hypothetical protein
VRALTVEPGVPNSARVEDVAEPPASGGALLVQAVSIGVCGTDLDIVEGRYGCPPPGRRRMILGHQSLGRVREAPPATGWSRGDVVVGIVRRPEPEPCASCATGEWDMCRNGRYTERGIKERGAVQLAIDAMGHTAAGGVVCLAGLSSGRREVRLDAAALTRTMVLENDVVFGSVNANRAHYEAAVEAWPGPIGAGSNS